MFIKENECDHLETAWENNLDVCIDNGNFLLIDYDGKLIDVKTLFLKSRIINFVVTDVQKMFIEPGTVDNFTTTLDKLL